MNKNVVKLKDHHEGQFLYLGRWVNKEHFCAFVYNEKGEQKLAKSYKEYIDLTTSGIWLASKVEVPLKRKPKDAVRSDS